MVNPLKKGLKKIPMNVQTPVSGAARASSDVYHMAANDGFPRQNGKNEREEFQSSHLTYASRGLALPLLSTAPAETVRLFRAAADLKCKNFLPTV